MQKLDMWDQQQKDACHRWKTGSYYIGMIKRISKNTKKFLTNSKKDQVKDQPTMSPRIKIQRLSISFFFFPSFFLKSKQSVVIAFIRFLNEHEKRDLDLP